MRKALAGIVFILAGLGQAGAALADEIVIAALGDSLTQGYGLPEKQGFVPQLQAWLDAQGAEVRLINAGVSGDTTAGGLSRVAWTLTPEVDGMIVALGGNDLLRGLGPEQARSNIDGILQAAETAEVDVLLIGMQAPGNFGPAYKSQFDAIYPELAEAYGSEFLESFFAGLSGVGDITNPLSLKAYFQADGVHPNAQGVALIVKEVGPKVLALVDEITG
ncbi:arylesterase [Sulfitobacter geojensis]|uniref:Arylesterase n=1 Tax=Sulfitobacter geojensis TaxID=1342299 RepID=A0AAE3B701_9RHOB|nr:arylesterase [Sulfitobacter geojensis]MBM1690422.1 arylesterase [Sulfitobacter geojensis]MBM1694488.1 arylesterase [Sulfitobacter geojensis]MBM1706654.1 arylesterase [Sulfitobacter geojensis]MBM1710712.1 arylesterase [Sulfitobacter geojensis]MBM1714778.1 arylesterase [Sulfitobacter geojensis]